MNTKNCKTNETHKIFLNLWQRLDLKSEEKRVALQNVSIYDIWKHIRKQYKKKLKMIPPTWNDKFELPDVSYFMSDIQKNMKH